jgi:hypothetical protein
MEIKQKKKMLLEVLLVIVFFVLVVFGIIYSINKIIESQPVQSSITFVYDEEALFKQNVEDAQSFIKSFIDNTEYNISDIAPWLNLKQRPLPVPEVAIENADAGASTLNEESVTSESLNPSINSKHEEVKPAKN